MALDTPPVQTTKSSAEVRFRPFTLGVTRALRHDAQGCTYLRAEQPLLPYPGRITDKLVHWARESPSTRSSHAASQPKAAPGSICLSLRPSTPHGASDRPCSIRA